MTLLSHDDANTDVGHWQIIDRVSPGGAGAKSTIVDWLVMVALCNRADHYIFILFLLSSFFFFFFLVRFVFFCHSCLSYT